MSKLTADEYYQLKIAASNQYLDVLITEARPAPQLFHDLHSRKLMKTDRYEETSLGMTVWVLSITDAGRQALKDTEQ